MRQHTNKDSSCQVTDLKDQVWSQWIWNANQLNGFYTIGLFVEKNFVDRLLYLLGDSWNYMPPILVPSSAKRIATQVLVIAKLNEREDFILRSFVSDITCSYREQS